MNKNLLLVGGVLAIVGLIVNAAVDLDNVYDMTTTGLWVLTIVVIFVGIFVGGRKTGATAGIGTTPTAQQ